MPTRRALLAAGLMAGLAAAAFTPEAGAQNFTKPVRIVVPFAPGGTSDIIARLIGPRIAESIGQSVVVENKTGANGNIGADFVAKSPPDGHTMLLTDVGSLATAPTLFKKLPFDVKADLVPVSMVLFAPYLFAVHPSVPANNTAELIAYAKANPGKLNVGNSGLGSANHLTALVFAKHYGIDWGNVPYRGGAAAIQAVVAGESNIIFNGATATLPFVAQKQMRGMAVSGDKRLAALPDLPTFKELNLPAVDSGTWQGFVTSKGTPAAMVARLNAEVGKALAAPDVVAKIQSLGGEVKAGTAEQMATWLDGAIQQWGRVAAEANIKLD